MDELSKCHKYAIKEVLGAVGLLQSQSGVSAREIYFVLDHLHGKVQRPVVNYAIKAAVKNGLLNCNGQRYKLRRRRGVSVQTHRGRTMRKTRSQASGRSLPARTRSAQSKTRRDTRSDTDYSGSDFDVPVRNYECSPKTRRSNSRRSYRFREVSSVESCDCASCMEYSDTDVSSIYSDYSQYSSDPKPRKKARKSKSKKKYPMPKKIKVEKKSSAECELDADDVLSTKSSKRGRKGKGSGKKGSRSVKILEATTTVDAAASPTQREPQAGSAEAENNAYNLRPRAILRVRDSQPRRKRGKKAQTEEASEQPAESSTSSGAYN